MSNKELDQYSKVGRTPNASTAPLIPPQALEGVRTRRIIAVCLDLLLVSTLSAAVFLSLLILSFGMSALLLPLCFPLLRFYNGLTISGTRLATPGMAFMDLEMRAFNGAPASFLQAAVHAVLFYVTWLLPPLLLASLFNKDKRCLHDIIADVIVIRRSNKSDSLR